MAATRPLEDFEIQRIFECVNGRYAARNKMLLVVGIGLALRATELVSLTVGDVTQADGTVKRYVTVRPETAKFGKERTIRIGFEIRGAIASFLKWKRRRGELLDSEAPLFVSRKKGQHLSRQALFQTIKKIFATVGVGQSPHCLRKTGGTLYYIESKFDLIATQQFLGHVDPATTRKYIGLTTDQLVEYSENFSSRLFFAITKGQNREFDIKCQRLNSDFTKAADAELILELKTRGYDVDALLRQRDKARRQKPSVKVVPFSVINQRA